MKFSREKLYLKFQQQIWKNKLESKFFEYSEVSGCVCGATFPDSLQKVSKKLSWGKVRFVKCPDCGSWRQSPQISVNSLAAWYDSDEYQASGRIKSSDGIYLDYEAAEPQRLLEAKARYLRDFASLDNRGGRVLEVGCASGSQLAVMKKMGWEVQGVDLSKRFVEMAQRLNGLNVQVGDFRHLEFSPLDLIIMLGTISNLQFVERHIGHVYQILQDNGLFYFNFPCADSLIAALYGKRYWMFTPSVSTFFSRKGIDLALKKAGFSHIVFKQDWQRPSFAKILAQAKLKGIYSMLDKIGLADMGTPFSIPVPGILCGLARKA
jgi:SAM-dependent methyltransferase